MAQILIPNDFKFTEEPIEIKDISLTYLGDDPPTNFNITFSNIKKCDINDYNPPIKGSKICKNCYYRKFAKKMEEVRKTNKRNFLNHQLKLRIGKEVFLNELVQFINVNKEYFNTIDKLIVNKYIESIKEIQEEISIMGTNKNTGLNYTSLKVELIERKFELEIFISHSSSDKKIAKRLIQVLKEALNIDAAKIRCTSVEGYKLEGGVNTDEQLRKEVEESKVFIGIISKISIKSHYVLFELGARWGLKLPFKPVVLTDDDYSILQEPIKNYHILNLSNEQDVIQLLEEISDLLNKPLKSPTVYLNSIKELVEEIKSNMFQN